MRETVQGWLTELGYHPQDGTKAQGTEQWCWNIVAPGDLEVAVIGRSGTQDVVVEAYDEFQLDALGSRRGADAAHRVLTALRRQGDDDVEVEVHRNGKAWMRSTLGGDELRKDVLARRLALLKKEHAARRGLVQQALSTGALPS